ncbi:MAG: sigma 54-interacting transcriptional regulator [Myxococcales bacterium]|nr:sigma 54-interacting transcriptional regulator [Myxococcales bacterium]
MNDFQFLEDMPIVRRMREYILRWWRLEVGFATPDGYVTDHARGVVVPPDNPFCRASLTSAEGFRLCNRSVAAAVEQVLRQSSDTPRAMLAETCHLSFPMLMVPVIHDGTAVGVLFTGGFVLEEDKLRRCRLIVASARRYAIHVDAPAVAAEQIPVLNKRDFEQLCDLVETLAIQLQQFDGWGKPGQDDEELQAWMPMGATKEGDLVGGSKGMRKVLDLVRRVATSDSTILITGENGTGKEMVARAIHGQSNRRQRPFVIKNCAAVPDTLLESELFGHTKGSFTGAVRDKPGLFSAAHTGTIFLDEVGDMSPAMQVKVLRVLQDGSFTPVGSVESVRVDVRVLAATNRPLRKMVQDGTFREDLFYRLNVINLHLPPLRERVNDIKLLADHFLVKMAGKTGTAIKTLQPGVMERFVAYSWPGNIRELQNEIERLVVLSGDATSISPELVSEHIGQNLTDTFSGVPHHGKMKDAIVGLERKMIAEGLVRTHWKKAVLARELGLSRTTLAAKIKVYNLDGPIPSVRD